MIKYNATVSILKQTEYAIIFRVFPDYPIRKFIPAIGGLDFSPIFAFILLNSINVLLAQLAVSIL